MKHTEKLPKANKSRPAHPGSTRTTCGALESLLGDLGPIAKRLQSRLKVIQRTPQRRAARQLWNTFEDIVISQMALLAGVSAMLEIQLDVKRTMGEA